VVGNWHRFYRGVVFGLAGGGMVAANEIADCCGMPMAVKYLKIASIICMLIGGALTVDKD
jgi:hypothetical protein